MSIRIHCLIHFVIYPLLTVLLPHYHLNDAPSSRRLCTKSRKRNYECDDAIIASENTISEMFEFIFTTEDIFAAVINLIPFLNCIFDNKSANKYRE